MNNRFRNTYLNAERLYSCVDKYAEEYFNRYKFLPHIYKIFDFLFLFEYTMLQENGHIPYGADYYYVKPENASGRIIVCWQGEQPNFTKLQLDNGSYMPLTHIFSNVHSEFEIEMFYRLFSNNDQKYLNAYKKMFSNPNKLIEYEWSFSEGFRTKPKKELTYAESIYLDY